MKILVISSNGFSKILNNGKTLEAMFSLFDKSNLCQIITRPQTLIDFDFCNSFYYITEPQVLKSIFNNKPVGGILQPKQSIKSAVSLNSLIKFNKKLPLLTRDLVSNIKTWQNPILHKWLKNEKPDLIFLVGGSKFLHSLALYIKEYLNIPLVTFFTDDYIIYPRYSGLFGKLHYRLLLKSYKDIMDLSSLNFVIGTLMSKEYDKFFNKKFFSIMNSLPLEEYILPKIDNKRIIISYFGGLHLNRWKMIARLGTLLPKNCLLNVYSASVLTDEIGLAFENSGIVFRGCVTGKDLRTAMLESDALLHVESDDEKNRLLTRLSVSTKIPEYLMAGRCIIGFGPSEVASMLELSANNVGFVIDSSSDNDAIITALKSLFSNHNNLIKYGKKAYDFAVLKYDRVKNAGIFYKKLESVISNKL